jgi:hypothetical protein
MGVPQEDVTKDESALRVTGKPQIQVNEFEEDILPVRVKAEGIVVENERHGAPQNWLILY